MFVITADNHSLQPDKAAGRNAGNRQASPDHLHTLKSAGLIFSGVMVSLEGIFAIVEYSGLHSRSMVEANVKTVSIRLDSQQAAMTDLGERMGRLEATTDYRFTRMDQRLDKIDERFEKIDERFQKLESKLDIKLERLEAKVDRKLDTMTELLLQLVEQKAERPASDSLRPSRQAR